VSDASRVDTGNLGFLLAKVSQHWNELLAAGFAERGFAEVRPSYGSVLLPLFEDDGLRMGQIAERARLSKQTMTTMVRLCERDGLIPAPSASISPSERRTSGRSPRRSSVSWTPRCSPGSASGNETRSSKR
jgi:hypothetical protein